MKNIYSTFYILVMVVVFAGCKSAAKMYQKGNYDEAVELAAKKLQKKPGDPELISVIKQAYRYAVNDHEERIRGYAASSNELRFVSIYNEYVSLQRLYDAVYHSPEVYRIVNPVNYSSFLTTYAEKAADVYTDRGLRQLDRGDKASARSAYYEFDKALFYKPGDTEIQSLKQEAFDYALTTVVILPTDDFNNGYLFSSYSGYESQSLETDLLRKLQYQTSNIFVRFYSSFEARSKGIIPDQIVDLRLNTINQGRVRDQQSTREVTREVVIKETVYKPDSVVKEYGKVKARITTTRRTLNATAGMMITIRDEQGNYLWSDNLGANYSWATDFASYTGDERALSEEEKKSVNKRPEYTPSESTVTRCLMEDLQQSVFQQLRSFYNRY